MSDSTARVFATFVAPDGTPDSGEVHLRAEVSAANSDSARIVSTRPVWAALDEHGSVAFDVTPSDDPDWQVTPGVYYLVHERLRVAGDHTYRVWVPSSGLDLKDARPVEEVPDYDVLVGGIEEAPNDGQQYGRQNETWTPTAGGGPHDHVHGDLEQLDADDHPQYLDSTRHAALGHAGLDYVPTAGGTMSGPLTLHGDPAAPLEAVPLQYVDALVASRPPTLTRSWDWEDDGDYSGGKDPGVGFMGADDGGTLDEATNLAVSKTDHDGLTDFDLGVLRAQDTLTVVSSTRDGFAYFSVTATPVDQGTYWDIPVVSLAADGNPRSGDLNVMTWQPAGGQYAALFVTKSGDTMTGPLVLSGDPTAALEAATKQYVDASGGGGVPEAPSDGSPYARQDASWVPAAAPSDIPDVSGKVDNVGGATGLHVVTETEWSGIAPGDDGTVYLIKADA